jgi:hypothetical protein
MTTQSLKPATQLRPFAVPKYRPIMRRIFDIEGTLAIHRQNMPVETVISQARQIFIDWLKQKHVYISHDGFAGKSFVSQPHFGYKPVEGIALDGQYAVQFIDDDWEVPQRKWMTEFYLDYREWPARCCVRQIVSQPQSSQFELPEITVPKLPHFVRALCDEIGLYDSMHGFLPEPWEVEANGNFEEFYRLLLDPDRTRPILALSKDKYTQAPLLNADWLAQHVLGIAHVVVLDNQSGWELEKRLGRDFTVFDGAIRTYQPGLSALDDEPYQHPLILSRKIQNWEGGTRALEEFLATKLAKACSFALAKSSRLYSFSDFRSRQLENVEEAIAPEASDTVSSERLQSMDRQLHTLQEERDFYEQEALTLEAERDQTTKQMDALKAENLSLLKSIRELSEDNQRLLQSVHHRVETYPNSLADLQAWAGKHWQGKLHFASRAYRGAKNSHYQDVELVYKALDLLANEYRDMRLNPGTQAFEHYQSKLQELGLDDQDVFSSEGSAGSFGDEYYIDWQGQRSLLSQHLKKGSSKDQRYCLRIYYFWCNETELVVIGWLPSHLRNRQT